MTAVTGPFDDAQAVFGMPNAVSNPYENNKEPVLINNIDRIVFKAWKHNGIQPAYLCSDAVFIRRVYIDVLGALPSAGDVDWFIKDTTATKRSQLIEKLLFHDDFADYWSMKWSDILRIKSEFPINLWPLAAQAYHRLVYTSIRGNKPYNLFVKELLTASGSNFRDPEVNFYRAIQSKKPDGIAKAVALTFMGTRLEKWTKPKAAAMAAFFSQVGYKSTLEWKEEIVYFDQTKPSPTIFTLPDGEKVKITYDTDPRVIFADWLTSPANPWFARSIVNRIWYWLMGRGIIHEPDDIRADNPPSIPDLVGYLEKELVNNAFNLKHIYQLILNSSVYQLSSAPRSNKKNANAYFAYYLIRRLDAEVLIDILDGITGTTEKYSSQTPEPYTFIPEDQKTICLADGSITSSFLDMFGRPARDTGLESERNNKSTPDQCLHLLNSSHIQKKLRRFQSKFMSDMYGITPPELIDTLYLTILSRYPTMKERQAVSGYVQMNQEYRRNSIMDTAWALINSTEFLYKH